VSTDCECIVIGAGVVGLAIGARLAASGHEVLILEAESSIGSITSSRNSEVVHAGIYYAANSLKARLCVEGRQALYHYCEQRHINHKRCGKLIVACTEQQTQELESIKQRASQNGVDDLILMSAQSAAKLEPELACKAALHSPSTGIVDSHGLMISLLADAESLGAVLALNTKVEKLQSLGNGRGFRVHVSGDEPYSVTSKWLVNSAGHNACHLATSLENMPSDLTPRPILRKGNYFSLNGTAPFSRLIYPVPEPGGLGVHITIDLAGQARFGPDVEAVNSLDYVVDPSRSRNFYDAVRQYWPALPDDSLAPDYSGVRPKISMHDQLYADFMIQSRAEHGLAGLVNLYGIESPGLTACLAIGDYVNSLYSYE